jgi:hypothetical protein
MFRGSNTMLKRGETRSNRAPKESTSIVLIPSSLDSDRHGGTSSERAYNLIFGPDLGNCLARQTVGKINERLKLIRRLLEKNLDHNARC